MIKKDTVKKLEKELEIESKKESESETIKETVEIKLPEDKYKNIKSYAFNPFMDYISKKMLNDDYIFPIKEVESYLDDAYKKKSEYDKEIYLSKYFYSASFQNDMIEVYTGNIAMGNPLTIVLEESVKNEITDKKKVLDEKIEEILLDYDFSKMSTYEKSKTIFDIVCDKLEYDYEIFEYITFTSPNEKYDKLITE